MNKSLEKSAKVFVKGSNRGRGGKDVDFRSKKQKNELHILKMSQEWDLRRQQRRLDRQKWVEERRNQKLPIWQRVGNLRVQANEEGILHEAGNQNVNNQEHTENSNEISKDGVANSHELREKVRQTLLEPEAKEKGDLLRDKSALGHDLVQQRYSTEQKRDSKGKIHFIKTEQARTMKHPLLYNVKTLETTHVSGAQIAEHCSITAFKSSSKSPTTRAKYEVQHYDSRKYIDKETKTVHSPKRDDGSVTIQKIPIAEGVQKERKRKLEAGIPDGDIRPMPKLMCVDKPTTLENIIERENRPVSTSGSTSHSSTVTRHGHGSLDPSFKGEQSMPQIKQCYSLLDRRQDDNAYFVKKSQSKSTPVAVAVSTPVIKTSAPCTAKGQTSLPSVAVDPNCIVYLPNSTVQTHFSSITRHPHSGYLVPVYKATTREPAYAFLPATTQHSHRVGDNLSLEGRPSNHRSDGCTSVGSTSTMSYPFPHSATGLKETHGGSASAADKGKFSQLSQPHHSLHIESASHNARAYSGYESSINSVAVTVTNPSQTDPLYVNGALPSGEGKTHVATLPHTYAQQHKTTYVGASRTAKDERHGSPLAVANKSSPVSSEKINYPTVCHTPEAPQNQTPTTQEAIFNPMSLYVRARLVPREVVTVNHGSEPSPPLVEYIKTDAICDKELTRWDAKNVRDFIAATDCTDKAELFLEEEIDGKALLSLSPEMLMKGMNLKLGPAVKLYNHIVNLRTALSL